jgi:hypothetical protein
MRVPGRCSLASISGSRGIWKSIQQSWYENRVCCNQTLEGVHRRMAILETMGHVPWFLHLASRIPGATSDYSCFLV